MTYALPTGLCARFLNSVYLLQVLFIDTTRLSAHDVGWLRYGIEEHGQFPWTVAITLHTRPCYLIVYSYNRDSSLMSLSIYVVAVNIIFLFAHTSCSLEGSKHSRHDTSEAVKY